VARDEYASLRDMKRQLSVPGTGSTRLRPLVSGLSVSSSAATGGTICCFVADDDSRYLLSTASVLALPPLEGAPIVQPGTVDGGHVPDDVVAVLSRWSSPEDGLPIDGALGILRPEVEISNEVISIGAIRGLGDAVVGAPVIKVGRTSGLTTGRIVGLAESFQIRYRDTTRDVSHTIMTDLVSEPGDAGALLLSKENEALGMLVAGGASWSVFIELREILKHFGVRLG